MTETPEVRLALVLDELKELSFVAHRDLTAALPAIEPYGAQAVARWAQTGRDLFLHDRDGGKAFLRASPRLAQEVGAIEVWVEQARGFLTFRGSWKALTAYLAGLPEAVRVLGAEDARRWADVGIAWARRYPEGGAVFFETKVADLADGRGFAGVQEVLDPLAALADERALPPTLALAGAIKVRALLGAPALGAWLTRGADILKAGRLRGETYFRLEGPDSDEALMAALPGFRTAEHERFLMLVTHAALSLSPMLAPAGLAPGTNPFIETDGRTLFVPPAFPTREQALAALLHHAGHLRFGTYDEGAITRLFAAAGMAHPPLDADQRVTWRPLFALFGADLLRFQVLFDLCEDFRIDARIQALMPNHAARLLALATTRPEGPAAPYFDLACAGLHMLAGRAPATALWAALAAPDADLVTSWTKARALYDPLTLPALTLADRDAAYLPGRSPNHARPVYPRAPSRSQAPESDVGADGGGRAEAKATQPAPVSAGHDPDMELAPEDTSGSGGRVGVGRPQPAVTTARRRRLRPPGEGLPYPEWDYREKTYRRDWARVLERDLTERDLACARTLLANHAPVLGRLKRAIQAEKPRRLAPQRRRTEGEELDLDATVDYVVDRRTGARPAPRIYRERRALRRDTGVLLLADLSTSIMQQAADGEGRVVDRMKAALLLFAHALEEVGDSYAIAGFASKYRDAVSFYPIKDFNRPLTTETEAILGGLSGRLATRMGAAIRHACVRFGESPAARRLLLILSDGRPADYDDGGDERYLHEDTRMAVKEAADQGIHVFCITLDAAGAAYLERIFGRGHYLVIDRLDDLPRRLPQAYLRLRKGA
ncbi:VWA domain-containing protein [Acidiferrobacter sp.]|uniref:nitric oxide reductase activation protein NorD n=1 Tax=Acidiferrobacter sp. TaxID=1872107 RepID=UPI002633AAD6|nr:VWA domain-containing protein [Acidiferrobacter sp.]